MAVAAASNRVTPPAPLERPLRVAVLAPGILVSGTEMVALTVAGGLRARGHDVRALVSGWTNGDFPARLAEAGVPHARAHLGKISLTLRQPYLAWSADALVRLPGALRLARRWLRDFDPEVVIANTRDWVLLLSPLLRGTPVLFHMHEAPPPTRLTRQIFRHVTARTTTFLAVSEHVGDRLAELGVPAQKTRVVHNGVVWPWAPPPRRRAAGTPFTFGIVGQVGSWKGHEDVVRALAVLRQRSVDCRCIVAGSGEPSYVARLRAEAEAHGVGDLLDWRGYVRDTRSLYAELDACVVPSRVEESFGLVAVEAGLSGVPVVAARIGGLREVVRDGETGFLVDAAAPGELAARLEQLATDSALGTRLAAAAQAWLRSRFTADRMIAQIEAECRRAAAPA